MHSISYVHYYAISLIWNVLSAHFCLSKPNSFLKTHFMLQCPMKNSTDIQSYVYSSLHFKNFFLLFKIFNSAPHNVALHWSLILSCVLVFISPVVCFFHILLGPNTVLKSPNIFDKYLLITEIC